MTFVGATAGLNLKKATTYIRRKQDIFKSHNLIIGIVLYGCAALINIGVLQYLAYTIVLPMTSITYVWSMFLSHRYLGENITRLKQIGMICIIIGAILISI